jgi:hypothetical protein
VSRVLRLTTVISTCSAAAVLAAAVFFWREPCLTLRAADGRLLGSYALERREPRFQIAYRHSVAKLPAIEYFRPAPGGGLELYKTAYQGLGAGLPFGEEGGTVRLEDGWILIEGLQRRFPAVSLSPMPLTEHFLTIGGRRVDLAALSGSRALSLRIERKSILGRLVLGRRMGYIKP